MKQVRITPVSPLSLPETVYTPVNLSRSARPIATADSSITVCALRCMRHACPYFQVSHFSGCGIRMSSGEHPCLPPVLTETRIIRSLPLVIPPLILRHCLWRFFPWHPRTGHCAGIRCFLRRRILHRIHPVLLPGCRRLSFRELPQTDMKEGSPRPLGTFFYHALDHHRPLCHLFPLPLQSQRLYPFLRPPQPG